MSADEISLGPLESHGPAIEQDMDVEWIQSVIPHRYPMLLVDRVLEIERGKRIVAIKNVTANEEVLQGHFPGHPIYPGVMLIEGIGQAGTVLLMQQMDPSVREQKLLYFSAMERARFRRPVVPGDQIRYEVEVLRWRSNGGKLAGRALVGDEVAAEVRISSMMVDR